MVSTLPVSAATESPLRVLVVDDDRDSADSLELLLGFWGFQARVAYDGHSAVAVAPAFQPDVAIIDLEMPRMDGCELARQLRLLPAGGPGLLIALTGYADEAHRRLSMGAGFSVHLIKPLDFSGLRAMLTRVAHEQIEAVGIPGRG